MDAAARSRTGRRPRWGTLALVIGFHVLVIVGLAQAFAPDFTAAVANRAASAILVTISTHEEPAAPPTPDAGASASKGKQAKPKPVSAPQQTLPVKPVELPEAASSGNEDKSGASAAGEGTGGGGEGVGTGSGESGSGQGSGIASKAVLISGSIEGSAKDFPAPPGGREERIGRSVIIALTVGIDGVPNLSFERASGHRRADLRTGDAAPALSPGDECARRARGFDLLLAAALLPVRRRGWLVARLVGASRKAL